MINWSRGSYWGGGGSGFFRDGEYIPYIQALISQNKVDLLEHYLRNIYRIMTDNDRFNVYGYLIVESNCITIESHYVKINRLMWCVDIKIGDIVTFNINDNSTLEIEDLNWDDLYKIKQIASSLECDVKKTLDEVSRMENILRVQEESSANKLIETLF